MKQQKKKVSDYKPTTIPIESLNTAKKMYMQFIPNTTIAEAIGVNPPALYYYIRKYWKQERDLLSSEFINNLTEARAADLVSIQNSSIVILKKILNYLAKSSAVPNTKEAVDVVKILESIDKLARVNPEEYSSHKAISQEELVELSDVKDIFEIVNKTKKGDK